MFSDLICDSCVSVALSLGAAGMNVFCMCGDGGRDEACGDSAFVWLLLVSHFVWTDCRMKLCVMPKAEPTREACARDI